MSNNGNDYVESECNQCDYKASQEHNLVYHIKSRHTGITYDCSQCNYKGARQDELLRHIEGNHVGVKYCD